MRMYSTTPWPFWDLVFLNNMFVSLLTEGDATNERGREGGGFYDEVRLFFGGAGIVPNDASGSEYPPRTREDPALWSAGVSRISLPSHRDESIAARLRPVCVFHLRAPWK